MTCCILLCSLRMNAVVSVRQTIPQSSGLIGLPAELQLRIAKELDSYGLLLIVATASHYATLCCKVSHQTGLECYQQ